MGDVTTIGGEGIAGEGWINSRWRPAIAWQYWLVCMCDFIVFPVFTTVWYTPAQYHEWHPLTLQGGGLYHLAMGGVIGVATWQRTQEKLAMVTASSGVGTITTERTTERSNVVTSPASTTPAKIDIKTDTVQVNSAATPTSRAD